MDFPTAVRLGIEKSPTQAFGQFFKTIYSATLSAMEEITGIKEELATCVMGAAVLGIGMDRSDVGNASLENAFPAMQNTFSCPTDKCSRTFSGFGIAFHLNDHHTMDKRKDCSVV